MKPGKILLIGLVIIGYLAFRNTFREGMVAVLPPPSKAPTSGTSSTPHASAGPPDPMVGAIVGGVFGGIFLLIIIFAVYVANHHSP